jgi:hypothetical protein
MTIKTIEDQEMEGYSCCKENGHWFEGMGALEKSVVRKNLLESKERDIKTSEFFEGSKASSSTVSARRTSLNNILIGDSLFFSFRIF